MERRDLIGVLAFVSITFMLFMPLGSTIWIYFLILGIVFGVGWVKK